jgi:hypothetical protein
MELIVPTLTSSNPVRPADNYVLLQPSISVATRYGETIIGSSNPVSECRIVSGAHPAAGCFREANDFFGRHLVAATSLASHVGDRVNAYMIKAIMTVAAARLAGMDKRSK